MIAKATLSEDLSKTLREIERWQDMLGVPDEEMTDTRRAKIEGHINGLEYGRKLLIALVRVA